MRHRNLAMIIALLSGAIITLLLITARLTTGQLWGVFFVSTVVTFILVWVFNEFLLIKDLNKLNKLLRRLIENKSIDSEETLKLVQSQNFANKLIKYHERQNEEKETLIKKSNLRRQFIADASHELKSPLFSAQGYVHTLLDGAVSDKEVSDKFLRKAARNLDYIDTLIQDLLTLSRIESQAIKMIPEKFDIVKLGEEIIEDREAKASKAYVSVLLKYDKTPLYVYADYSRIMQVLTNLVNNGINYNNTGGSVILELSETDKGVKIAVIDDGVGIDEEYHEKVFNRFFRIDKSRTVKKSTGLGLAIVKHILERHNSTIHLESSPGNGATFSFVLSRDKGAYHEAK